MRRVAVGIILYKPTPKATERVAYLLEQGVSVFVFDNTPDCSNSCSEITHQNFRYMTSGNNVGIGLAMKLMCATAFYQKFDYFLFFDQDTAFTIETIRYIEKFAQEFEKNPEEEAKALSVTFRDKKSVHKTIVSNYLTIAEYTLSNVKLAINSGTLFNLQNLKKVGWHDSRFFVDGVDYHICLMGEKYGLNVLEISGTPGLDHCSEQDDLPYSFFGKQFLGRKYATRRVFDYIGSNIKLFGLALAIRSKSTSRLAKMFFYYIGVQIIVRIKKSNQNSK